MRWEDHRVPFRAYFQCEIEVIGGDDCLIICPSDYCLDNRLGTKVEAGRPVRRLLRKTMMIPATKIVRNGGILHVFWNMGTGFASG